MAGDNTTVAPSTTSEPSGEGGDVFLWLVLGGVPACFAIYAASKLYYMRNFCEEMAEAHELQAAGAQGGQGHWVNAAFQAPANGFGINRAIDSG